VCLCTKKVIVKVFAKPAARANITSSCGSDEFKECVFSETVSSEVSLAVERHVPGARSLKPIYSKMPRERRVKVCVCVCYERVCVCVCVCEISFVFIGSSPEE